MPWFIVQSERKTWTKYIVEADDEESALGNADDWVYFGYVDGDDTKSNVIGGTFNSDLEAMADIVSFTED